jgi:uncharacterized protein YigE (DUF2233 family)
VRAFVLALLFLAACGDSTAKSGRASSQCSQQTFEGSRFTVCDPKNGRLQLFASRRHDTAVRSFADLQRVLDPSKVAFAMNAGMFDEEGRPIGLAIVDGKEVHAVNLRNGGGNFHLKPNGVFMVQCNGSPAIFRSDAIPMFRCAPRLSTQSGPMVVIDGKLNPQFEPDGQSRYVRNGVGVTKDGKALFVISDEPVSFGKFGRFFRDALKTPNALYFDGAVSSLWDPASFRQDSHSQLGPIIVAFKAEASKPDRASPAKP